MILNRLIVTFFTLLVFSFTQGYAYKYDDITIHPIGHASFMLKTKDATIMVDPVGSSKHYKKLPAPDIILITHHHKDRFSKKTINSLRTEKTLIIAPPTIERKLYDVIPILAKEKQNVIGIEIEAVAAYNTTPSRKKYHPKGSGVGYVITINKKKIYVAGDTELTPEMRKLKNIDLAFIPMNIPYTMTANEAVKAVSTLNPKAVIPYSHKGKKHITNIRNFARKLKRKAPHISSILLEWY